MSESKMEKFCRATVITAELDLVDGILDRMKDREWIPEKNKVTIEVVRNILKSIRSEYMGTHITSRFEYIEAWNTVNDI